MAQGAARGQTARDVNGDVRVTKEAANQSRQESRHQGSITEASKVISRFGYRVDECMQAYSGVLNEFGCRGNTVDHWRVQFVRREAKAKAANGRP